MCLCLVHRCHCVTGYTGLQCEININECASNPCVNHATCVDALNSYICKCSPGFTGSRCETGTENWHFSKNVLSKLSQEPSADLLRSQYSAGYSAVPQTRNHISRVNTSYTLKKCITVKDQQYFLTQIWKLSSLSLIHIWRCRRRLRCRSRWSPYH